MEVGRRGRVYTYRYTVTTKMTCIKMGSDESRFNVSLIVRGTKSQDSVQKPQLLKRKESRSGIEPRSFRLPAYRLTARLNRLSGFSHHGFTVSVEGPRVGGLLIFRGRPQLTT